MPSLFTLYHADQVSLRLDVWEEGQVPSEGMAAVAVLVSPSNWRAVVAEVHQSSVVSEIVSCAKSLNLGKSDIPLRRIGKQIKQRVMIQEEILRIPVLRADDIWSLDRIATEEDGLGSRQSLFIK